MNWDNLRYVLAVADAGSILSASRSIGVNRTTVLRRINAFETELGCRLFVRSGAGYVLTAEAEEILGAARVLKQTIVDMERRVDGRELRLQGDIRVTTTDALMTSTVAPLLAQFSRRHPHIKVELSVTNQRLSVMRRDVDIAIRPTPKPPEHLVGRKLSDIRFAKYASREYLREKARSGRTNHRWLSVDEPLHDTPAGKWLKDNVRETDVCYRADSFVALRMAAENSVGLTVLPRALGDMSDKLCRVGATLPGVVTGLWILTHADLLRSARIHALIEHFSDALHPRKRAVPPIGGTNNG